MRWGRSCRPRPATPRHCASARARTRHPPRSTRGCRRRRSRPRSRSTPAAEMTVAVLGTGTMGAPMAVNVAGAGLDVRAWNRTPDKAQGLDGVTACESIADAVEGADLVVTILSDGDAAEAV